MQKEIQTSTGEAPFKTRLRVLIRQRIEEFRADGTTAVGLECLMQCVQPPQLSYPGAPLGTNARYFYAQMFREICREPNIRGFIL